MNYIETIRKHTSQNKDEQKLQCRIIGAIFEQDGGLRISKCAGYNQQFDFPYDTQTKLDLVVTNQKKQILRKINNILQIQSKLPKELHDYNEYDNLIT